MEEYISCKECNETLTGRSGKKFCDKACSNAYNNRKRKNEHESIRGPIKAYEGNFKVLKLLYQKYGTRKIPFTEVIALGFNSYAPARVVRFKEYSEEFSQYGEYAFCSLENKSFIKILKLK